MAKILDGKNLSGKILDNLKKEIKKRRLKLKLAVILVGNNAVSRIFVREKKEACKKIGAEFKLHHIKEEVAPAKLREIVKKISADQKNSGVVIQLPLPGKFDTQKTLNLIPEQKDVDILSERNFKKFSQGKISILSPTVGAIFYLLKQYKIGLTGKYVVIVGAGRLVGKPLSAWLKLQKNHFAVLDKETKDIASFTRRADILITGAGKANLIRGDMVKRGAVVIDVGTSRLEKKIVGDVDFKSVSIKVSCITPVPGGVGPLTVACLLDNLVKLSE